VRGGERGQAAFQEVLKGNQQPAPGSPAAAETKGEPFAGEWGAFPSRDELATTLLAAASAADHLVAVGSVLRERNAVFAPYTVMRAAAEAAAMAVYLTDPAIDGRERVRRNVNYRLDAFCEQIRLVGGFTGDEAARMADRSRHRLGDALRGTRPVSAGASRRRRTASAGATGTSRPSRMSIGGSAVMRASAGINGYMSRVMPCPRVATRRPALEDRVLLAVGHATTATPGRTSHATSLVSPSIQLCGGIISL
jgi:hypothetical protein